MRRRTASSRRVSSAFRSAECRLREGFAFANSPGLIDAHYRGEIKIVAVNLDPARPIHILRGEKIAQLGKYLFDNSFDVELDDKLAIVSRSLQGLTLPFDSLSVGTQEQLGLIVRLACSLLVDQQQGVPLIFDDTLGHTDPQRLEGMGAMLNHAGQHCQIVILTCTPGRFRHIGNARTISLRGGPSRHD